MRRDLLDPGFEDREEYESCRLFHTREPEDDDYSVMLPQRKISEEAIASGGLAADASKIELTQKALAPILNLAMRSSAAPCERVH